MTSDPYSTWDAAYVFGALSADERAEFEEHLAGCDACRAAVGELAGIPGVLGRLDRDTALAIADEPPTAAMPHDLMPKLSRRAGRGRRLRRVLVATGVAAALAIGFLAGAVLPRLGAGDRSVAFVAEGRSAVTGHLTAASTSWGTRLDWNCAYGSAAPARYASRYELTVTATDGSVHDVASWAATGMDSTGLSASVALPLSGIRSVAIRTTGGTTLAAAPLS